MEQKVVKKPNTLVYSLYVFTSKVVSKLLFNLKYDKKEFKNVKGPCLILANHESKLDFIFLAAALGRKAHFVISNSFYQVNPIKPLLTAVSVIPKQQFQTSLGDMRRIKASLDNNIPLIIYPAGMMSENGVTTPIPQATGKTAKWLNHDVYVAYITGSYLSNPKWGKKWRKGQMNLSIKKLYSKEELANTDPNEIQEKIEKELYYDSYENQEKLLTKYKNGDNIEGLENVLYWCPKCNSYHSFEVINKNTLICKKCGNKAIANKYGFLEKGNEDSVIYKHPSKWSLKIKEDLENEITSNKDFLLSDYCEIKMINYKKKKFETVGNGLITLDHDKFELECEMNRSAFSKSFNIDLYPILPFTPGSHFEIQDGKDIYRIILKHKEKTAKWMSALEILYKLKQKEKQPVK